MNSLLERIATTLFPNSIGQMKAYNSLIRDKNSYLYQTGWIRTKQQSKPVDRQGNYIPWMNFPVAKLLDGRLTGDLELFEFGSGFSTYFYAARVKFVTSVEYDEKWFNNLVPTLPKNVQLLFKPSDVDGSYCRTIVSLDKRFDVVIVDGRDRVNCVKQAMPCLTDRGVLLLDDSQRDSYSEAMDATEAQGFRALEWEGLKPGGNGIDRTTVFYRDGNCFGI